MDTFRKNPRGLQEVELNLIEDIKNTAEALEAVFDDAGPSREMSIARTKLEEAVMWATKGISG